MQVKNIMPRIIITVRQTRLKLFTNLGLVVAQDQKYGPSSENRTH